MYGEDAGMRRGEIMKRSCNSKSYLLHRAPLLSLLWQAMYQKMRVADGLSDE